MALGAGTVQSLLNKRTSEELAQVQIVPLTKKGLIDQNIGAWALQYWPESISIGSAASYASKSILGGSHPLQQYLYGTERTISFRSEFTRDYQGPIRKVKGFKFAASGTVVQDRFNVDCAEAMVWLDSLKSPDYDVDTNPGGYAPPPLLYVVFPKCKLGRSYNGEPTDVVQSVLLSANHTVNACFPDGTPRHVSTDITIVEVVQGANGIIFPSRSKMASAGTGGQRYGVSIARPMVMR